MNSEGVKQAISDQNVKLYQLEEFILKEVFDNNFEKLPDAARLAEQIRAEHIEQKTNTSIPLSKATHIPTASIAKNNDSLTITKGTELKIGAALTPLSITSPLKVKGEYAKNSFHIPLATNEAALVAGIERGIKALNQTGGVTTIVRYDGMTRAPLLEATDIVEAKQVCEQINNNSAVIDLLKDIVEEHAQYSKLKSVKAYQLSNKVWLRFTFTTGNAMGMNSAVKYTSKLLEFLLNDFPNLKLLSLSGNICSDKKQTHINILEGRGKAVEAEAVIPYETIKNIFKVNPQELEKLNHWKNYVGSALAGTTGGYNANASNTIAALFIATGQDCAQIVESSACFTHIENTQSGLRVGVSLPSLEVATVGGGTQFGTAQEMLQLLQCTKEEQNSAAKLAEIFAAAVLAQELNLLCTLSNKFALSQSHLELARGETSK